MTPRRPHRARHSRAAAAAALLLLAAACTAGPPAVVVPSAGMPPAATATPVPSATVTATATAGLPGGSPLLGGGRVLAVKIDNTGAARPRIGLDAADIVYVTPVEGGLTRLLAVFASRMPPQVGPVRSAREFDATILANYGAVAFAYSGASALTASTLAGAAPINVSMDVGGRGYRREPGRRAPYNVIGDPAVLLDRAPLSTPAGDVGFRVGAAPAGGRPGGSLATAYPAARIGMTWDAVGGRYLVTTDGRPEAGPDGTRASAAGILVQWVASRPSANRDVNGMPTPTLDLIGSGRAQVLRGGAVYDGTWSRASDRAPTVITGPDGSPLTFPAGPLWVLLVPDGQAVSVS